MSGVARNAAVSRLFNMEAIHMSFIQKRITTKSGLTFPYIEQGEATGTPIIFLHGVTDSHRSWELVFPHLDPSIRAIAVTQRGHGDASKPDAGYSSEHLAADVAEVMDALAIPSAVIAGHSMGSYAAQRFAVEYPERTAGLVLIGSFASCADNEGVKQFVAEAVDQLSDPIPQEFAVEFQQSTTHLPVGKEFFDQAVAESLKAPARVWKAACNSMIDTDHRSLLGKIEATTLLIWGDQDAYFSIEEQQGLLKGIEGSRLSVYEGVGHAPNWEEPERTAKDIQDFVESLNKQTIRAASSKS